MFKIVVARHSKEAIGLDIDVIDDLSAVIIAVKDGVISAWNRDNPALALRLENESTDISNSYLSAKRLTSLILLKTCFNQIPSG